MATTPTADPAEPEPAGPRSWFLTNDELAATRAKIAKLQARAARKGFTGDLAVAAQPATRSHTPAEGAPPITVHGWEVIITGSPPVYNGWQFLAAADTTAPAQPDQPPGVILRYPPGADQGINIADVRPGECDHCHTHRSRTTTFLVLHTETGELMQVGRTCLKDFLGWNTWPVFINTQQADADIERSLGTRTTPDWDLESVLTYAWAVVETHGWTPASSTSRIPTRDLVGDALRGGTPGRKVLDSIAEMLDEGAQMAPRIISDLTAALNEPSGYQANLAALLRAGRIDPAKHLGLAVSAINAWRRLQHDTAPDPAKAEPAVKVHHAGRVGEKLTLTGTVTVKTGVESYHPLGSPQLLLVLDCSGVVAKTITSAAWAFDVKRGEQLTLTGTVKAHTDYHGTPQTVLVRPRLANTTATQPAPAEPPWETVEPVQAQSRFQETPLAAPAPLAGDLAI